ncbi:MAG: hypothetical protein KY466_02770 [Gemmatimonadetes bacterium]|nr:hypothetical protein [Gemmatimonadota bacterium]
MIRTAAAALLAVAFAASPAAAQEAETGTFVLTQNGTVIATETFTRSAALLRTELDVIDQATLQTRGTLRPDATISRLAVRVFGPGGVTGEPVQTSAVNFADGLATFEQPIGEPVGEPKEVEPGAVPYVYPSPSLMEQILRRARAVGSDTLAVPVWTPGPGGGRVIGAVVAFHGEGGTLAMEGVAIEITSDAVGRLLSARIPAQSLVIERK